jgi:hypothetical protein
MLAARNGKKVSTFFNTLPPTLHGIGMAILVSRIWTTNEDTGISHSLCGMFVFPSGSQVVNKGKGLGVFVLSLFKSSLVITSSASKGILIPRWAHAPKSSEGLPCWFDTASPGHLPAGVTVIVGRLTVCVSHIVNYEYKDEIYNLIPPKPSCFERYIVETAPMRAYAHRLKAA